MDGAITSLFLEEWTHDNLQSNNTQVCITTRCLLEKAKMPALTGRLSGVFCRPVSPFPPGRPRGSRRGSCADGRAGYPARVDDVDGVNEGLHELWPTENLKAWPRLSSSDGVGERCTSLFLVLTWSTLASANTGFCSVEVASQAATTSPSLYAVVPLIVRCRRRRELEVGEGAVEASSSPEEDDPQTRLTPPGNWWCTAP